MMTLIRAHLVTQLMVIRFSLTEIMKRLMKSKGNFTSIKSALKRNKMMNLHFVLTVPMGLVRITYQVYTYDLRSRQGGLYS